jgi:hypothetical protein
MPYPTKLTDSPFKQFFSGELLEHLQSEELEDAAVVLNPVEVLKESSKIKPKEHFKTKPSDVRLPARLSSPLIPYPEEVKNMILNKEMEINPKIHSHHQGQICSLLSTFSKLTSDKKLPVAPFTFDINVLKRFGRQKYSLREDVINLSTLSFARRSTTHDLSIAAGVKVPFSVAPTMMSSYTGFIIMIQRLRVHIAKETVYHNLSSPPEITSSEEAKYTMFTNGTYMYSSNHPKHEFHLLSCGGHFFFYHSSLSQWFSGPSSYLDYVFTMADILNNIDVIKNTKEYEWANEALSILIEFAEYEGFHNDQVNFMKNIEGFILNLSDYDESYAMNWKPILEAVTELWILDRRICNVDYDIGLPITLMRGQSFKYPKESFLCRIICACKKLSRTHCQEISALHKFIFYAEVDARAGVDKFLKRVHTKRPFDKNAVKNITRLAKQKFLISYRVKHKTLPNLIGPQGKIKMLEAYGHKGNLQMIDLLPLSWWDDLKIFDCMDNTLTDDPLEFAKDKGALKSELSFGPGDSRKELLQVIEKKEYDLKDFFATKTLIPLAQKVYETTQLLEPKKFINAARLIEKEREQKVEARLYGNAILERKHSLSLVATKMKKALAYFDEQLMTPSDKKRKHMIHDASRELAQPDNFSLLLDIEGHNQSMQYENTSELAEFIGNLFGYDGWGELPHYFSSLTVYHYDEYLDKAIVSEGQFGGIEGWLNPLWTLHTLLMMKLLRNMTDLDVPRIMVYSDDVNAIMKIRQASEPMVKAVFSKIMAHCLKFGMVIKYSQTTLSKHRITMLRQHYADGIRADSTLKRLISISGANNPVLMSEELEISGISSSASSALELSNHNEACAYLKNYKIGLLLSRLPQMILSKQDASSMICSEELPAQLSNLLYYTKDDQSELNLLSRPELMQAAKNDIARYLQRNPKSLNENVWRQATSEIYGTSIAEEKMVDSPDRVMYLQIYDEFLQDLLFFWAYLPCNIGGLGASLHLNLILSGHSSGFSKAIHYLHQWICNFSSNKKFFLRYLSVVLSIDMDLDMNLQETRLLTSTWQNDKRICPATQSVKQAIKSMVHRHTKNESVRKMFAMSDNVDKLQSAFLEIFRGNFHARIAQFYLENTSCHFIDLLLAKIETSSGLLVKVKNILKLRQGLSFRMIENIRMAANTKRTLFFEVTDQSDIISDLLHRKVSMFPKVKMIEVEEVLYDDKFEEMDGFNSMLTIRRCSPLHYVNGIKVFDDPKMGNETLYKGELLDDDRMLGNKEELLSAKLVAITKWFLMKFDFLSKPMSFVLNLDCVKACNLSLKTLTGQNFFELFFYAPTEVGGEILHRIPNTRFSTMTYIRSEMNRSLTYTTDLNQSVITRLGLVDSNINFDYVRMRFLVAAIIQDKYDELRFLVKRYALRSLQGIRDVQFVKPMEVEFSETVEWEPYAKMRGHVISFSRFRYLSHAYLFEDDIKEWALMPKLSEEKTADQLGEDYVNDIILRYAKDLDRDYMMVSRTWIDEPMWKPLIVRLEKIDRKWSTMDSEKQLEEIKNRLFTVLEERSRVTMIDKSNPIHIALQSECLEAISQQAPTDLEFDVLITRFSQLVKAKRRSQVLSAQLARYQRLLSEYEMHKENLALSLIMEYIMTFHFKIGRSGSSVMIDFSGSIDEFYANPMGKLSYMIMSPELQTKLLILGAGYIEVLANDSRAEIRTRLQDICEDIALEDIIMPVGLPTLSHMTHLTGDEEMPNVCSEIVYEGFDIPNSAMATLEELHPLAQYAHKCSTTGASPYTFVSHTGSDSLMAQVGLFNYLKSRNYVNESMIVCDLTSGRGDGQYALKYTGLNGKSYSLEDTFTRLNHHPHVEFRSDYDIFDGKTIKFVTDFDFVHVDISFTGQNDANVLDLILFLEENNLAYSIRMNSLSCKGYIEELTTNLPNYRHELSYASNAILKPYQIYLIGIPTHGKREWQGPSLKQTMAFKAIALAYTRLLHPRLYFEQLTEWVPNSATIAFPSNEQFPEFLSDMLDTTTRTSRSYYINRYISEFPEDDSFIVNPKSIERLAPALAKRLENTYKSGARIDPIDSMKSAIGQVSQKSYQYHEAHVILLINSHDGNVSVPIFDLSREELIFFRTHHPLQSVRSLANIAIGIQKFAYDLFIHGRERILAEATSLNTSIGPKISMHQREIQLAIKLHVLSARDDDYTYGLRFIHKLLSERTKSSKSLLRTLRIYRLLGHLHGLIKQLINTGMVTVKQIESISDELEHRETQRYKYTPQTKREPEDLDAYNDIRELITASMDELFESLERFALMTSESAIQAESDDADTDALRHIDLTFDIDINRRVEEAIQRLNLTQTEGLGFIDIGDTDLYDEDEFE